MGIRLGEAGESNVIELSGAIEIAQAAELKAALLKGCEGRKPVRVMLAAVTDLDLTAYQLLWAAKQQAVRLGLEFVLEGQPEPSTWGRLKSAGLDGLGIS